MGAIAIYDEENDRIRITDGDKILRDEPAMAYSQFQTWAAKASDQTVTPKALRNNWLNLEPNTTAMLVARREYQTVSGFVASNFLYNAEYARLPDMTIEELDERVQGDRGKWLETEESRLVATQFEKIKQEKKLEIKKLAFIGSGSFRMSHPQRRFIHDKVGFQLAAVLKISEVLGGKLGKSLPIIAQELFYSQLEKEYLHSKFGITVVDDPDVFSHIDKYTLVVAPCVPVTCDISQHELPAAMIVNHPGCKDPHLVSERLPKAVEMFRHYSESEISPLKMRRTDQNQLEPLPNKAFIPGTSLWVKRGGTEELGPSNYVPPDEWQQVSKEGDLITFARSE